MTEKNKAIREIAMQAACKGIDLEKSLDAVFEVAKPLFDLAYKNEAFIRKALFGDPK